MSTIKLFHNSTLENGTLRLQSQFLAGTDTADFILKDGILKHYRSGDNGFNFYETDIQYLIVTDIKEMRLQEI